MLDMYLNSKDEAEYRCIIDTFSECEYLMTLVSFFISRFFIFLVYDTAAITERDDAP
jgi:hypothetical protein